MQRKTPLTIAQILRWADQHRDRTGRFPISRSGPVVDADDGTTWEGVNTALSKGARGLPGGDSLRRVLRRRRRAADARAAWPDVSAEDLLRWTQDHHQRTGSWPRRDSGRVRCARGITWQTVDRYLRNGTKSMAGGSTLAAFLKERWNIEAGRQPLNEDRIVKWAEEHRRVTGRWPVTLSGPLHQRPGEDWAAIDMALRNARRGLTRKTSLSRLLTERLGERYKHHLRAITIDAILDWADRHERRFGRRPTNRSGPVHGQRHLTWSAIDYALRTGRRGLPGGTTLAQLLDAHGR